jgi:hypothetical protein
VRDAPGRAAEGCAVDAATREQHAEHLGVGDRVQVGSTRSLAALAPAPASSHLMKHHPAINRAGNNLNQLVHLAHTGTLLAPDLMRTLLEVRNQIEALSKALHSDSDPADAAGSEDFSEPSR